MVSFNEKKGEKKERKKKYSGLELRLATAVGFSKRQQRHQQRHQKQRQNPACRPISPALITRRSARQMKLQSGRSDAVLAVVSTD